VLARIPHRTAELRELVPRLEPVDLVSAAARHGVSAWVAEAFSAERLTFAAQAQLIADARATVASAHKIKRLTLAVIDALATTGVEPVALKGAVLAQRLYPHSPLCRPSTDVDVLVRPDELPRVATVLEAMSLARQVDQALGDVFEDHHHLSFAGPPGLVEVHFRLISTLGRGLFDDASVRARTSAFTFEGRRVLVLSPEDEFLYLATHAANHGFLRIGWLVDLQQFLRYHPALDFEAIAERARDAGFLQALSVTLGLLEGLLAVELPRAARIAVPPRRRRWVDAALFSGARVERASLSGHRLGGFALRLWLVDSPRRGFRHVLDGLRRYARRGAPS